MGKPRSKRNQDKAHVRQLQPYQTPETAKPSHLCEGFVLYGAVPDERYLSMKLGFQRTWNSVENLAHPASN